MKEGPKLQNNRKITKIFRPHLFEIINGLKYVWRVVYRRVELYLVGFFGPLTGIVLFWGFLIPLSCITNQLLIS